MRPGLKEINGGGGIPPEPDWRELLTDTLEIAAAHEIWGVVTREMRDAETLSPANGTAVSSALERYVIARLLHARAARDVLERGAIILSRKNLPTHNGQVAVMRRFADECRMLEAELGISPVRRGRARKVGKKRLPAAALAYLSPRARMPSDEN